MLVPWDRCVNRAGNCPTVCAGIISAATIGKAAGFINCTAPDNHFITASPNCCMQLSRLRRIGGAGGHPAVGPGIVSSAGVEKGNVSSRPRLSFQLPVQTAVCQSLVR